MNLALIPARAESKRFPGKNTALLCGKPLICYTIESVLESGIFDRIIVSSDDPKVLSIAEAIDGVDVHRRPKNLASDTVTTIDVLLYLLDKFDVKSGACGLFLPTSPFREKKHIIEAREMLTNKVDSVVGVCYYKIPPSFSIEIKHVDGLNLLKFPRNSPILKGQTQIQSQLKMVHPNGAIYLAWISKLLKNKSFFKGMVAGYLMDRVASIDIDEEIDLEFARSVYKKHCSDE